jgi:hypothetical protein
MIGFLVKFSSANIDPIPSQTRDGQTVTRIAINTSETVPGLIGDEVPCDVVNAFKKDFSNANDVNWSDKTFFFEVEFTYGERRLFAFYSLEGKFMGLYHHISSTELPEYLRKSIKENYRGYWITELFKSSRKTGDSYYLTLQNADDKIMFRSHDGTDWKIINYQF